MWKEYEKGSEVEKSLLNAVEMIRKLTSLGNMARTGDGCEAAVTARPRYRLTNFMECGEQRHEKRFLPKLKGAVYKNHVRPAIPYNVWCLK